jgi:hypothetical protein
LHTNRKRIPLAAGVLDICGGVIQLLLAIILIVGRLSEGYRLGEGDNDMFLTIGLFVLSALLALIGSIYCIRRTRWPMALIGSVAASALVPIIITYFVVDEATLVGLIYSPPGIAAIALTVLSKTEFK